MIAGAVANRWPRVTRWALRLLEFGAVQIGVQLLNAVAGLLIVRTLPKSEYAWFAIANSMLTACTLLADLGIGLGVRSMGGRVCTDRTLFGALLKTGLALRFRFAIVTLAVCVPIWSWMLLRNGAPVWKVGALLLVTVFGFIALLGQPLWGASALLHGEYRRVQKLDFGNAALRVSLLGSLAATAMNAVTACLVGAIGSWIQNLTLRRWALEKIDRHASPDAEYRREFLHLSWRTLPNTLFFCLQGQVTLAILTIVGNPVGVADLSALSRVVSLFTPLTLVFGNVLAPRFSRLQDAHALRDVYRKLAITGLAILAPFPLLAWLLPQPFLWLIGPQYTALQHELAYVVAATVISQFAGFLWALNSAKAWIRAYSVLLIPATLLGQVAAALLLDLRQFHDLLLFNLVTAAIPIPLYLVDARSGLRAVKHQSA